MPKDITNPAVIIFLKEMYDKEKRVRAQWNKKHQQQLQLAGTLNRESTNYYETDVITHNMIGGLATITRDHVVAGYNRRKVPLRDAASIPGARNIRHDHSILKIGLGDGKEDPRLIRPDTDLSLEPVMRPVDPKIKIILYKPRPVFGREQYLKKRSNLPEQKYYLPECSNWDYGWRSSDSGMYQRSHYGRCWVLTRTLNCNVGPQPDPTHYRSADFQGALKCVDI